MDFKNEFYTDGLGLRHRAERQAAEAPAFLRRDSDRPGGIKYTPEPGSPAAQEVREIPLSRATADLVYALDTQAQMIDRLYDRLNGVLESVPGQPDGPETDPCPYSTSTLVNGLANHARRVAISNTRLADILARLAI